MRVGVHQVRAQARFKVSRIYDMCLISSGLQVAARPVPLHVARHDTDDDRYNDTFCYSCQSLFLSKCFLCRGQHVTSKCPAKSCQVMCSKVSLTMEAERLELPPVTRFKRGEDFHDDNDHVPLGRSVGGE
ncbi:unnamed protein product [Soboliphyme baturini]|uniref:HIT-type domain-containing protein n=1 Tax=Soboliphyme baturini TaxID=241478 RepID=A0A183IHC0_9BILA|nr:unnamed protein product [Soboliphyme baturini]